jgi:hypothetical protein
MGTNYYWHRSKPCPCCNRPFEKVHIGKSSGGWHFSLHIIPEEGINNLEDWLIIIDLPGSWIEDEYGQTISKEEMIKEITERSWRRPPSHEYLNKYTEKGYNNLLRYTIDGQHCVGHGDGTWDLIIGEFS